MSNFSLVSVKALVSGCHIDEVVRVEELVSESTNESSPWVSNCVEGKIFTKIL